MESKAKIFGHPIHPILIVFPLGLLTAAVIFDAIYYFSLVRISPEVGFWMAVSGIAGGLLAAVFGAIDWWAIPSGTRAKSVGLYHGILNVVLVVLFITAVYLRIKNPGYAPNTVSLVLELVGAEISLAGGWLGGELVHRLNVSNDTGAHLNSPSSLSGRPASEDLIKEA
jgi:uncharacterized membrane protein